MNDDQEFIKTTLNKWNLSKWYNRFIEEDIDKEAFFNISETEVSRIISTIGGIRCFLEKRKLLTDTTQWQKSLPISENHSDSESEKSLFCQKKQLSKAVVRNIDLPTSKEKNMCEENYKKCKAGFSKPSCSNAQASTSYAEESSNESYTCIENYHIANDSFSTASTELNDLSDILSTEKGNVDSSSKRSDNMKITEIIKIEQNNNDKELNKISCISLNYSTAIEKMDLKKLLLSVIDGHIIMKYYEKHDILDETKRRKLTDLLITQIMFKKCGDAIQIVRLLNADFDVLCKKIQELFPNEKRGFYYVPPKSEGISQKISKGKLPDFYRNKLYECRQIELIERKRRRSDEINDSDIESNINAKVQRVCETHLQWLRYNTTPWLSVKEHWNGSRELRQIIMKEHKGNVHDIFKQYPVLRQELGYTLLDDDYNAFIDEKSNIYNEWPQLCKNLETLLEKRVIRDKTFAKLLEEIQLYEPGDECRDTALLASIPVLCPCNARLKIPGGNKIWRPTIAESMDAFICHIKVQGELERVKRRKQETANKLKLTVQPYIVAVGLHFTTIEAFYIVIDDTMYKMENVLKAIDILYKIFQVLDIKYPPACEQIWLFIQTYVYGRTTKWDKIDKSVMNLVDQVNKISKQDMTSM